MNHPIPAPSQKSRWPDLTPGSLPWALTQSLPEKPLKVMLTQDVEQALRLQTAWQFFRPQDNAVFLPDWETLPYERFSPHQDLVSERLAALWQVKSGLADVLVVPVATAMQKLAPVPFLLGRTFWLKTGQTLDAEALRRNLADAGYSHVSNVVASGEFAMRGGILDIFPMGAELPYRLDLFGDEIDSIKTFDPDSQRTIAPVSEIRLLPAHEFPTDADAQKIFRTRFREEINADHNAAAVYQAVSSGRFGAGVEYYLPLFFENGLSSLFDYIGGEALLVCIGDVHAAASRFWADIKSRFAMAQGDETYPPLHPQHLYLSEEQFAGRLKAYGRILPDLNGTRHALPDVAVNRQSETPLSALQNFQTAFNGRILLTAESAGRRETMLGFFAQHGLKPESVRSWQAFLSSDAPLAITVTPLAYGFQTGTVGRALMPDTDTAPQTPSGINARPTPPIAVITESDLYQYVAKSRSVRRKKHAQVSDGLLRDLAEINTGDPVVHEEHGIGRYMGLVTMDLGEGPAEMMLLEYAGGAQLYVPVSHLHLISRYSGQAADTVQLHKLGSGAWSKAKRKAAEKARDTAAELLNLYARRAAQEGFKFTFNEQDYQAFSDGFGYEETEDQAAAIGAVLKDLTQGRPMDRLVCGDVGFGKTEVALRAAFVAVMGGKQVAVLAPTTLLVEQHAQNFADRFADFPVKVAALSRFNSGKTTTATLKGMTDGTVDIVIGTHKLVQENIQFKNLGLVIIDEEHRFGVRQKEQLKRLRANVDMLTLTATPIPRTLSMALEGLRDFSLITTAPSRRLAVKTFVKPFSEGSVREAVLRELKRGGQVFFLHNEVETIENMRERLETLLPEARIGVAHGQLRERELEQVMRDFLQQRFNVLLCSTIIETGIDIPNANTIIINRADKFGLAQLHQLRGRVGRSHHQAYAYLLTPEHLTKDAEKRLDAIAAADELGAGFTLAMQDLEIRGAGEILGEGQSGEMMQVGFTLYKRKPRAPYRMAEFADGTSEKVWCTFDEQQVDLDVTHPVTKKFIKDNLEFLSKQGASIIRLDAFAYANKKIGTNCFFVEPEIWETLKECTDVLDAHNVTVLPEIHEHYTIQLKIAEHDYYVYDFALPMLVLHTLFSGRVDRLVHWLEICPRKQFTTLDTHDGIGVVDVKDLMTDEECEATREALYAQGANVKKKYSSAEYNNLDIYQINCTYYSALGNNDQAYILARALQCFAPGIPQIYYVGLLAGENDIELLEKTKEGRNINRHYYSLAEIDETVKRPVVQQLFNLLKFRNTSQAFDGEFSVKALGEKELEIVWNNAAAGVSAKLTANTGDKTFAIIETVNGESREITL